MQCGLGLRLTGCCGWERATSALLQLPWTAKEHQCLANLSWCGYFAVGGLCLIGGTLLLACDGFPGAVQILIFSTAEGVEVGQR